MSDELTTRNDLRESQPLPENTHVPEDVTPRRTNGQADDRVGAPPEYAGRADRDNRNEPMEPLFSADDCIGLRSRWEALQVGFVDEPRRSVEQADKLVNETVDALTRNFTREREKLDQQWHGGQEASTEDLRLAFRRDRSFFDRLLTM